MRKKLRWTATALLIAGVCITAAWMVLKRSSAAGVPEFRILCIGESTTAPAFTGDYDNAWPHVLEEKLNARSGDLGFKTVVFNEGVAGTNTLLIRMKLDELIEKYNPDAVITMMGVSDANVPAEIQGREHPLLEFLRGQRLSRIKRSLFAIETPSGPRKPSDYYVLQTRMEASAREFIKGHLPLTGAGLHQLYDSIKNGLAPRDRGNYNVMLSKILVPMFMANELGPQPRPETRAVIAEYLDSVFNEDEISDDTFYEMFFWSEGTPRLGKIVARALERHEDFRLSDQTISRMLHFERDFPPGKFEDFLKSSDLERVQNVPPMWRTQENYQKIARALKSRGILNFSMMYPSGSVNAFHEIFSDAILNYRSLYSAIHLKTAGYEVSPEFKDVIFISNENFKDECTAAMGDCFMDAWMGNPGFGFGHATPKGHGLIADNALAEFWNHRREIAEHLGQRP